MSPDDQRGPGYEKVKNLPCSRKMAWRQEWGLPPRSQNLTECRSSGRVYWTEGGLGAPQQAHQLTVAEHSLHAWSCVRHRTGLFPLNSHRDSLSKTVRQSPQLTDEKFRDMTFPRWNSSQIHLAGNPSFHSWGYTASGGSSPLGYPSASLGGLHTFILCPAPICLHGHCVPPLPHREVPPRLLDTIQAPS